MKIEYMIYIYGIICISMIIFNIVYTLSLGINEKKMSKRIKFIEKELDKQFKYIENNGTIMHSHLGEIKRKLTNVNNLIAFDKIIESDKKLVNKDVFDEYLSLIYPVIIHLSSVYIKRDIIQAGYFSYFMSQYASKKRVFIDSMQEILLEYVKKDNIYCRINALQALYSVGNIEYIIEALIIQDKGDIFIHEKILTEGLLTFNGNHDELINSLLRYFNKFTIHTQLAILNYIRFKTGNYKKEMKDIMLDENTDKELRLSAMRYFGKYKDKDILPSLLKFATDKDDNNWEYRNVAVTSLSSYDGDIVIDVLKDALHSSNWYVRYSAAESLEKHGIGYSDLIDIVSGNDRYAREMMMYRLESRNIQKLREENI